MPVMFNWLPFQASPHCNRIHSVPLPVCMANRQRSSRLLMWHWSHRRIHRRMRVCPSLYRGYVVFQSKSVLSLPKFKPVSTYLNNNSIFWRSVFRSSFYTSLASYSYCYFVKKMCLCVCEGTRTNDISSLSSSSTSLHSWERMLSSYLDRRCLWSQEALQPQCCLLINAPWIP